MRRTRKIAMVGLEWNRHHARLLAGGLQHAGAHPNLKVVIRPFTRTAAPAELAASIERWGADAIYGLFSDKLLEALLAGLKHPLPIVNNAGSPNAYPGVFRVLGEADAFVELAVQHFRHSGIKHLGMLFTDPRLGPRDPLLQSFRKLTQPNNLELILPIPDDDLMDLDWSSPTVPAALAAWLREIPKPCGILCPCLGSGKFLIECCGRLGLHVPRDIAIAGTDDADMCLSCTPTLTSIAPNVETVGSESVRILLGILGGVAPQTRIIRIKAFDTVARESTGQHGPRICDVSGALEYIQANATKGLSVAQLMRATQRTSEPTFYGAFYEATGKTPAEAIRDRRLDEVRRLLATTQFPVAVVASMAGFSSSSVMGRLFLKVDGITALDYRKRENIKAERRATTGI
jgi:LacI family transcriptional regulator